MTEGRIDNARTGAVVGDRVMWANTWWARLRGLLGRPEPGPGEGMLLDPCKGVHMYGMQFPLDIAVLDGDDTVMAVYPALQPGHRTPLHRKARRVLELPVGTLEATDLRVGDAVRWQPAASPAGERTMAEAVR